MDCKELMEYAVEQIRPHLPEGYEIGEVLNSDSSFQLCLKNQAGVPVRWFQFAPKDDGSFPEMIMTILAEIESYTKSRLSPYTISADRFRGSFMFKKRPASKDDTDLIQLTSQI